MNKSLITRASILTGLLIITLPLQANDLQQRQSELKSISVQINKQASTVKSTYRQREQLLNLLKKDEEAIAAVAKKINQTKLSLKETETEMAKLNTRQDELNTLKKSQQSALSKQLTSAYLAGNYDYSKMLLNQQSPASIERMLTYYKYLNNARIESIKALQETLSELDTIEREQEQRQTQLNSLMLDQSTLANKLKNEQVQRKSTLTQLQNTLNTHGAKLEQLQIEQASLKHLVDRTLSMMKTNSSMAGLKSNKKLSWPTPGRIKTAFGNRRSGKIKWKGVTISAPEGRNVNAIAAGKVIYADWLRGFGMVLVIDHGKGYMSLYGYAQALLKEPGDTVQQGQTIALVGRSGGQSEPSLYFEVRYKGQAVDPARYCAR
ncbi:murein hydrolase activator EnvC family protein [Shewanella surugensis]|uniref:Peptidoglycan DD-metalloendopeptidase family protein n=1 Tax=Shewanella surugensis TaxID=212020 RepID=A0ABT0LDL3_9GAMM|nr:peptidoglycan DD-metalloendopeptidase family protein [Shewanella surugensis]MCL1125801.1 peptidoglycan DD-metalloendopeptidase family protein [Shewanella surugensis]